MCRAAARTLIWSAAFTSPIESVQGLSGSITTTGNQLQLSNFTWSLSGYTGTGSAAGTGTPIPMLAVTPTSPDSGTSLEVTASGDGPQALPPAPTGSVELNIDGTLYACGSLSQATADTSNAICNNVGPLTAGQVYSITIVYTSGDLNYASDPNYPPESFQGAVGSGATVNNNVGVTIGSSGGSSNDWIGEANYGTNPVAPLSDGTNWFDVEVDPNTSYNSVTITDCNNVTAGSTTLDWWNPLGGTSGTGAWQTVQGDEVNYPPEPNYLTPGCVAYTLDNTTTSGIQNSSPDLSQLNGTVFGALAGRAISSVDSDVAMAGSPFSLEVSTIGSPVPSIKMKGKLPSGLHLVDNHNGTATLSGTPNRSKGGFYQLTISATFGTGKTKQVVNQTFSLFVLQAPLMTVHLKAAHLLTPYSATVAAKGYPTPTFVESGALPNGIGFSDNHNGTATLVGTPSSQGTYPITIVASNGEGGPATANVSLVVK